MAYIGRGTENISNVEVLDNLTFNGSASYTLQKSSTNFVPISANNLLISISGVVQQGNFSVSGSTITFDTTVSSSDTCDWILHYGTGLITTVADGALTEAKLGSNAVTTAKINNGAVTYAKTDGNFGKIGQVIYNSSSTNLTSTSTSFSEMLNASITPTSTSSKIIILFSVNLQIFTSSVSFAKASVFRGTISGTNLGNRSSGINTASNATFNINGSYVDSPNTTSAQQYTLGFGMGSGGTSSVTNDSTLYSLTLMEVLA